MVLTTEQIDMIAGSVKTGLQLYLNTINTELALILEIYKIYGLQGFKPLTVTQTERSVDEIFQTIFQNSINKSTTITRA